MLNQFLTRRIINQLPFEPNEEKEALLDELGKFLASNEKRKTFLLKGYAGTGKTSVASALVRALNELNQKTILLAPTGRAAKVIAAYSGFTALTIHKKIYRQNKLGEERFSLSDNLHKNALFIVDEASMISAKKEAGMFGSGCLLEDLIKYVYSGEGCALLFIGDTAQLPPVGQDYSPALDERYMQSIGLQVHSFTLHQVARQALESGILQNATALRECLREKRTSGIPTLQTNESDVFALGGADFLEELESAYSNVGEEETLLITRTNKRANIYNQTIRNRILGREDQIEGGDRIMVTKNNYFFTQNYEGVDFLANGDMFEIVRVHNERELYGYHFADASLRALDYDWEIDVVLWLDTLFSESPEAAYPMQKTLFVRIAEDYPEIRDKRELTKTIYESPYFNALQFKFAYAVTCHKAQGGQWERVFIDPGYVTEEMMGDDYYRWFYTAVTRAKDRLFLLQ